MKIDPCFAMPNRVLTGELDPGQTISRMKTTTTPSSLSSRAVGATLESLFSSLLPGILIS